jgi:hypothetical protein
MGRGAHTARPRPQTRWLRTQGRSCLCRVMCRPSGTHAGRTIRASRSGVRRAATGLRARRRPSGARCASGRQRGSTGRGGPSPATRSGVQISVLRGHCPYWFSAYDSGDPEAPPRIRSSASFHAMTYLSTNAGDADSVREQRVVARLLREVGIGFDVPAQDQLRLRFGIDEREVERRHPRSCLFAGGGRAALGWSPGGPARECRHSGDTLCYEGRRPILTVTLSLPNLRNDREART